MQCQGRTRLGRQCRNRALEGELFCDIHMRVRHNENLLYLLPALTVLGIGFLLIFGLIFKSSTFAVFDISFIEYAGIEDIVIQALRLGLILLATLFALWLIYALSLALVFAYGSVVFRKSKVSKIIGEPHPNELRF